MSATQTNDPATMRRMGDTESSIAYWQTREVLWNGERVTVQTPARGYPINQRDEE